MRIDILTLFPQMCETVLNESVMGRGRKNGKFTVKCTDIRDYSNNKHNKVDDAPFGGGMGMIMAAEPIYRTFEAVSSEIGKRPYLVYMSPKGKTLTQEKVNELAKRDNIAILCGHYEGIDERIIEEIVDEEISIGDYVITGGEMAALVLTDAICRTLPGVLSDDACFEEESHYSGLLEYPQYTRPAEFMGKKVPDVLLSGNHEEIRKWRRKQSLLITKERRPDMFEKVKLTKEDLKILSK